MKKIIITILGVFILTALVAQDRGEEINWVLAAPASLGREARAGAVKIQLRGVFVLDGLLWFPIRVSNGSVIDWRASPMRFSIRNRRELRRRARQEVSLPVLARREFTLLRSDSSVLLCYGVAPRIPRKGQQLVLDYAERNGDRRMTLRLSNNDILKAKKIAGYADR